MLIEIGIAIEIAIGSIGEAFDNDPDPDFDFDFDLDLGGSVVLHCKNLTRLHRSWPLKDL